MLLYVRLATPFYGATCRSYGTLTTTGSSGSFPNRRQVLKSSLRPAQFGGLALLLAVGKWGGAMYAAQHPMVQNVPRCPLQQTTDSHAFQVVTDARQPASDGGVVMLKAAICSLETVSA
jgi:hypothetical protein